MAAVTGAMSEVDAVEKKARVAAAKARREAAAKPNALKDLKVKISVVNRCSFVEVK